LYKINNMEEKVSVIKMIDQMDSNKESKKFLLDLIEQSVLSENDSLDNIYWEKDGKFIMCYNRKDKKFYLSYDFIWSGLFLDKNLEKAISKSNNLVVMY
jgi:hypothetical protein